MDHKLEVELAQLSGPTMSGKVMAFFRILKNEPTAQRVANYLGSQQQYTQQAINANPSSRSAKLVRAGIVRQLEQLLEQALGGSIDDGGMLSVKFNRLPASSKQYVFSVMWKQLTNWDPSLKPKKQPSKPKQTTPVKPQRKTKSVKQTTGRSVQQPKKQVPSQQKQLATNLPNQLSKRAQRFLNTADGQAKLDATFPQHKLVLPWVDELEADRAVSKARLTTPVGKIRGFVLDGPDTNFLSWLKDQFALNNVLTPHALELAFNSKHGLQKVPRGTQIEAMYLIARFSVENDWGGLAAVFHGRYVTEFANRRKQGWGKLSVTNTTDGLVNDLLSGDFDQRIQSIFVETAFWYYLTRWAYLKVDTSQRQDGAYLKHDESNYSQEAQRILSTIRQDAGSSQSLKNQSEFPQIKNTLRQIMNSEQDLRGLVGLLLAHELLVYASDPKHNNFPQQLTDRDGKVTPGTQNTISRYLTQDPVVSQFERIIQQAVPELGKRISEYQQGERQR